MKKNVFFFLGALNSILFFSCIPDIENEEGSFVYKIQRKEREPYYDTVTDDSTYRHVKEDILIAKEYFTFKGGSHTITLYSSDNHADIDGGELMYELDSLGVIYRRSTTWLSYARLYTNKKDTDQLIDAALEQIILQPSLQCYQYHPKPADLVKPEIVE